MKQNIKRRMLSAVMATTVAVTSLQLVPSEKIYAATSYTGDFDSKYAYNGDDLGCNYTKEATTFKVWAPTASKVVLTRYKTGDGGDKIEEVAMKGGTQADKGVWSCTVDGDIVNTYYTYKITTPENGEAEACDLYAKTVGVNGNRAMVVDMNSDDTVPSTENGDATDWDTNYKRTKTKLSDMVTWEVHVRDFSYDKSSGVKDEYRGKYLAFTQQGTTLNNEGNIQTGIDYLKKLGITHVQILPMYDYGSVDENNSDADSSYNWGYDPKNYNAPEGSYSTNAKDGNVRVKELREMVQALHNAGIKVIMDVVYNHTYMKNNKEEAWFDETVPKYYYRTKGTNSTGAYTNGSGCGNETRSESAMYRKFMRDSIMHWAKDYNLDGFRFDLMGLHDVETMNAIRADLDKEFGEGTVLMYGEGWTGGDSGIAGTPAMKENVRQLKNIGFFNDQIRDASKGEANNEGIGSIGLAQQHYKDGKLLNTDDGEKKWPNNVYGGIKASVGKSTGQWWMWRAYWSDNSNKVVSYASCHDNLSLWDKLVETGKRQGEYQSKDDKYIRMNRLVGGYILTSHGGAFMQAGEEFARTKNGDENSYASSSSTNAIDWKRVSTYSSIQEYYKGMIAIRRVFSGFRNELTESGNNDKPNGNNITWIDTDSTETDVNSIAYYLSNSVSGEWNKVAVMINNTTSDKTYNLSEANSWVLVSDGEKADIKGVKTVNSSSVTVPAKSVAVAVPKDTFDANPNVGDILNSNTNSAPTISGAQDQTVSVGSKVEFTVTAKDADGDKVTLSATELPKNAEFDAATGKFTWDNATEGVHSVKFTATDGKDSTTKTVKITVTSATTSLETLVDKVENEKLTEADLTKETWNALSSALTAAKEVLAKDAPTEQEKDSAVNVLTKAYETAFKEKAARDDLKGTITTLEDKLKTATGDAYDADAVADAKTVVEEANKLIETKGTEKAYLVAIENLQDASAAVVSNVSTPQVHVKTSFATPHIYIWTGSGTSATEYSGKWPGEKLTKKDADGNYVFELEDNKEYNIIINNGDGSKEQTSDLEGLKGDITIELEDTSSSQDADGNSIYKATTNCKEVGTGTVEVTKDRLNEKITEAKALKAEDYASEGFEALQTVIADAEAMAKDTKATQVKVNQQTRKLRAAILALVRTTEEPQATPTPTPVASADATPTPSAGGDPTVTETPTVSPTNTTDNPSSGETPTALPTGVTPTPSGSPTQSTGTPTDPAGSTATPTPIPSGSPTQSTETPIQSTETPIPAKPVVSKISFSPSLTQVVKKSVKISAKGTGGSKDYNYQFKVLDYNGTTMASQKYSTKSTFTWKPKTAGTYTIEVKIKDTKTGAVSKSKTAKFIVVKKKLSLLDMKLSKKTLRKGKTIKVTAKATGGKTKYKYSFVIKNAKGKVVKKTSFTTAKTIKWKPVKIGKYKITVTVKDATKSKVTKTKKYTVVK